MLCKTLFKVRSQTSNLDHSIHGGTYRITNGQSNIWQTGQKLSRREAVAASKIIGNAMT